MIRLEEDLPGLPQKAPNWMDTTGRIVVMIGLGIAGIALLSGLIGLFGVQQVNVRTRAASNSALIGTSLEDVLFGLAFGAVVAVPGLLLVWIGRRRASSSRR